MVRRRRKKLFGFGKKMDYILIGMRMGNKKPPRLSRA